MKFVFFGFLILYFGSLIANPKCDQADLILEDASIYNGFSDNSFVGSIGIKDSKISFIDCNFLYLFFSEFSSYAKWVLCNQMVHLDH